MNVTYTLTPPPAGVNLISLADAKKQLRIEHSYEDTEIQGFIDAAIAEAESYLGTVILKRNIVFGLEDWSERFDFPIGPIGQIDSLKYLKSVNTTYTTAPVDQYKVYNFGSTKSQLIIKKILRVANLKKETLDAIKIDATVGYDLINVPGNILQAVKLILTDFYEFRGDREIKINRSSRNLLRPFKYFV